MWGLDWRLDLSGLKVCFVGCDGDWRCSHGLVVFVPVGVGACCVLAD